MSSLLQLVQLVQTLTENSPWDGFRASGPVVYILHTLQLNQKVTYMTLGGSVA